MQTSTCSTIESTIWDGQQTDLGLSAVSWKKRGMQPRMTERIDFEGGSEDVPLWLGQKSLCECRAKLLKR